MPMDFQLKSICDQQHKEIEELEQQLKQTQDRLKDAESVIGFYANESYAMEDENYQDDYSLVYNGNIGIEVCGKRAREYFKKYGDSDE
jgi:flagellar biosynthesis chaperone FliJ